MVYFVLYFLIALFSPVFVPRLDHGPQSGPEGTRQRQTQVLEKIHQGSETP